MTNGTSLRVACGMIEKQALDAFNNLILLIEWDEVRFQHGEFIRFMLVFYCRAITTGATPLSSAKDALKFIKYLKGQHANHQ